MTPPESTPTTASSTEERYDLSNLAPAAGSTRARKRVGRGPGSGTGKTSGRGQKGQKSRSGSHMMPQHFHGGQNPLHMQMGKQRGPHKKTSMPFGPFRTTTQPINLRDLARRFDSGAEVTPETLLAAGLLRHLRHPVKILGVGELSVPLTVSAHGFSASARQKIEAAGGSAVMIGIAPVAPEEAEAPAPPADPTPEPEPAAAAEPEATADAEPEATADAEPDATAEAGDAEAAGDEA